MSSLYIVGTPIGNLNDISQRALDVLQNSDLILAEDTRKTKNLLSKYRISTPLESFHEHNEEKKIPFVISLIRMGKILSLVSDAGTPTISDPGFKLVREAVKEDIKVVPIPGPSAITTALSASGLPTDQFIFLGYFPKKKSKQHETLSFINQIQKTKPTTIIFYESPFRLKKTLQLLSENFPRQPVVIARELTKIHEEFIRGTSKEVFKKEIVQKGEVTILLR